MSKLVDRVSPTPMRVLVLGATGTIGRATVQALLRRGHEVVCFVRSRSGVRGTLSQHDLTQLFPGASIRFGDVSDPVSLANDGFRGEPFDALVSCLASRTGDPADAWAIDYQANVNALQIARDSGVRQVVLLSAICVQKPLLAFQHAKLEAEKAYRESGLIWSIVRPTAFFKSLSGQIERVKKGKPYLVFGDGRLTACKPISDQDLGDYLADCLNDVNLQGRVLPIGGPGPAVTPRAQAEHLFECLGRPAKLRQVPVGLLDLIVKGLSVAGRLSPAAARKAELARIGRYYATESMLVLNPDTGRYDPDSTPSTGTHTYFDYQARLAKGDQVPDLGDHAVF